VPVRSDSPSVCRSAQSERDRRAISVVGHLLTTGIWLEHQLRNTPTPRTGLVGTSGWVRSPLRRLRSRRFAAHSAHQETTITQR
jgi:hypothetical protein